MVSGHPGQPGSRLSLIHILGLSEPKNLDEFHEVLTAFKEQDANGNGDPNDEIPLSVPDGMSYLRNYLPYFGYNLDSDTWLAIQDGKLV